MRKTLSLDDVDRRRERNALAALTPIERFEAKLCAERNRWSIERSAGRLNGNRLLRRADADRTLRLNLAALAEGGGQ
jgi:hypothetical protein